MIISAAIFGFELMVAINKSSDPTLANSSWCIQPAR